MEIDHILALFCLLCLVVMLCAEMKCSLFLADLELVYVHLCWVPKKGSISLYGKHATAEVSLDSVWVDINVQ